MKQAVFFFIVVATVCLFSCSSPENDGKSMANKLNKCNESYLEEMQKMESDFIAGFNGAGFQSRTEAKQAYFDVAEEVYSKYRDALAKVYEQEAEMSKQYISDYKKKSKFDNALSSNIDQDLESKVVALTMATEIPESVIANVRTIIPPKPDYGQIQKDLVGHKLSEGVDDGYYSSNWFWLIKEGEISGFNIESVLSDTPQDYLLVANMRLTSEQGKAFDVKLKVRYVLPKNDDWTIEFVQSLGMHIVKTGNYINSINTYLGNGSWDRPLCIENVCEIALEVGGSILAHREWKKFYKVVKAHSSTTVGWVVEDYRIDYVEIP